MKTNMFCCAIAFAFLMLVGFNGRFLWAQETPVKDKIVAEENKQTEITLATRDVAEELDAIIADMQKSNVGSDEEFSKLHYMTAKLRKLAIENMPEAAATLADARSPEEKAAIAAKLADASRKQQEIIREIQALLASAQAKQELENLRQTAKSLSEKQKELNKETNEAAKETQGKPLGLLNPEEKRQLKKLSQNQQQLAETVPELQDNLKKLRDKLRKDFPDITGQLYNFDQELTRKNVKNEMESVSKQLSVKDFERATTSQKDISEALEEIQKGMDDIIDKQLAKEFGGGMARKDEAEKEEEKEKPTGGGGAPGEIEPAPPRTEYSTGSEESWVLELPPDMQGEVGTGVMENVPAVFQWMVTQYFKGLVENE